MATQNSVVENGYQIPSKTIILTGVSAIVTCLQVISPSSTVEDLSSR